MKTTHENEAALAACGWAFVDQHSTIEAGGVVIYQATIERTGGDRTALYNTDEGRLIDACIKHARTYPARGTFQAIELTGEGEP